MTEINSRERLIVALDLETVEKARRIVEVLGSEVQFYKIGLTLQLAPGVEEFIRSLIGSRKRVFLDYKYYDIAATMEKAVARAVELGVSFLTVHGATQTIQGAVKGRGKSDLKLFAVTVLTNMDQGDIAELGYANHTVEQLVLYRARKALDAGCDGVIASGQEAGAIKALGPKLLVVTPGIRPDGYPEDDQKRKTTPAGAISAGADYLVVGRPITGAANPRAAAAEIIEQMQRAFDARQGPGGTTSPPRS
jgi:orotidine-5'-phosphate decarboxylase